MSAIRQAMYSRFTPIHFRRLDIKSDIFIVNGKLASFWPCTIALAARQRGPRVTMRLGSKFPGARFFTVLVTPHIVPACLYSTASFTFPPQLYLYGNET